jgi:hypothetical protein
MPLPQTNISAFTGMNSPTRDDPEDFDARAEDAWNRLGASQPQFNTLAGQVNAMADAAQASAGTATTKAGEASTSAGQALTHRNAAEGFKAAAETAKGAAETARDAAASSASALTATSTTSNTLTTGAKTFAVQTGKQFAANVDVKAVSASNAANALYGTVTSYSGTSLVTNMATATGAGSATDWVISVVGQRGQQGLAGGTNAGNLTGALNELKGATVPSSASPDIWGGGGNYVPVSGTTTITGFPAAPQAGARRRLLATGTWPMTAGANVIIKGGSFTAQVGDEIEVVAETTTSFRVTRLRADGGPNEYLPPTSTLITSMQVYVTKNPNIKLRLQGGGGGGYQGNGGSLSAALGGKGGDAGAYIEKTLFGVPVGTSITVVPGAAGAGGFNTTAATAGTDTTVTVPGFGTFTAKAGMVSNDDAATSGVAAGGDLNISGQLGGVPSAQLQGGSNTNGGDGGNSMLGMGGRGRNGGQGTPGRGYGSGGASGALNGGTVQSGGAGAAGCVIIED